MIRTGYSAWYDGDKTYYVVRRRWLHDDATIKLTSRQETEDHYDEYGTKYTVPVRAYYRPDGVKVENRALIRAANRARDRHERNLDKQARLEEQQREEAAWTPVTPAIPTAMAVYRPSGTFAALAALFRRLYLPRRCSPPRPLPEKTP